MSFYHEYFFLLLFEAGHCVNNSSPLQSSVWLSQQLLQGIAG